MGGMPVLGGTSAQAGCPHGSHRFLTSYCGLHPGWFLHAHHDSVALLALYWSRWGFPHNICLQRTNLITAKLPIHMFPPCLPVHKPHPGALGSIFSRRGLYLLTFGMGPDT